MGLGEIGMEVMKALVPPKTNDLDDQQRWRWMVFAMLMTLATGFIFHLALECGYLPSIHAGFASATEQSAIQRRVDVIVVISLEHEIRSKTAELCGEKNQQRRDELNDDISKLQREYFEVEKRWYNVPSCDKL